MTTVDKDAFKKMMGGYVEPPRKFTGALGYSPSLWGDESLLKILDDKDEISLLRELLG